ncbi:alcohol dehydrogenase catalytic domain-containing protein [Pseudactinotalea terrae]|uniref:alcohol dehydrogenase catalytic domain-containing protein n=1 Tax=Pseudactinotalea terrae TaxID=1743262 RepID=UPI0012E23D9E|nr:alcohol dehydrogenase catalytic domain-containing protein [Pseudactinotalea terrae]
MLAAVVRDYDAGVQLEKLPDPVPSGDAVVVDVLGAGICHTDLHLLQWRNRELPLIMGHEIAGTVPGYGPVLVHQSWGCGHCRSCRRGEEQLCSDVTEAGFERPGGYAEKVLVPHPRYLIPLGELDPRRAAPLTDAAATSYRAVRRAAPWLSSEQDRAVVIGAGALGQFAIQFLRLLTPAHVIAVDLSEDKRADALVLGAHEAVTAKELGGRRAEVVLDLVTEDDTLALAAALVEPGGMIMRIGSGNGSLPFGRGVVPPEVTFMSARGGSLADVTEVVELARAGRLRWETEEIPLTDVVGALDRLARGDVQGRLILTPGGPA